MPRSDNPNYFAKLQKCHVCTEPCPQAEMAREIGEDRLYKTQELIRLIKQIDSGELVPVVHGRWERRGFFGHNCSNCGALNDIDTNYCPNCGAKMEG